MGGLPLRRHSATFPDSQGATSDLLVSPHLHRGTLLTSGARTPDQQIEVLRSLCQVSAIFRLWRVPSSHSNHPEGSLPCDWMLISSAARGEAVSFFGACNILLYHHFSLTYD